MILTISIIYFNIIGDPGDTVYPQLRSVSWLMRVVEDMYDARFIHEKNHAVRREIKLQKMKLINNLSSPCSPNGANYNPSSNLKKNEHNDNDSRNDYIYSNSNSNNIHNDHSGNNSNNINSPYQVPDVTVEEENFLNSFPVFVVRRLTTVVGLINLTDQIGWDLLCNTHRNYTEYLEIETFKNFLEEKYNNDDLLFFLYVRSLIAKILKINFSTRWILVHGPERQPKIIYLTFIECTVISHKVFGPVYSDFRKELLSSILKSNKLIGLLSSREDKRKIDVRDFLNIAMIGFRKSQTSAASAVSAVPLSAVKEKKN